jgi:hypothetical protein
MSPYQQVWSLMAVWMFGGLMLGGTLGATGHPNLAGIAILALLVIVSVTMYRIRCPKCGEGVIRYPWRAGRRKPWEGVPWGGRECTKCGHPLDFEH